VADEKVLRIEFKGEDPAGLLPSPESLGRLPPRERVGEEADVFRKVPLLPSPPRVPLLAAPPIAERVQAAWERSRERLHREFVGDFLREAAAGARIRERETRRLPLRRRLFRRPIRDLIRREVLSRRRRTPGRERRAFWAAMPGTTGEARASLRRRLPRPLRRALAGVRRHTPLFLRSGINLVGRAAGTVTTRAATSLGMGTLAAGAIGAAAGAGVTVITGLASAAVAAGAALTVLVAAASSLSTVFDRLTSEFEPVSGSIAALRAQQRQELILQRQRVGEIIGRDVSGAIEAQTAFQKELIQMRGHLAVITGKFTTALLPIATGILEASNDLLALISSSKEPEEGEIDFAHEAMRFLTKGDPPPPTKRRRRRYYPPLTKPPLTNLFIPPR